MSIWEQTTFALGTEPLDHKPCMYSATVFPPQTIPHAPEKETNQKEQKNIDPAGSDAGYSASKIRCFAFLSPPF